MEWCNTPALLILNCVALQWISTLYFLLSGFQVALPGCSSVICTWKIYATELEVCAAVYCVFIEIIMEIYALLLFIIDSSAAVQYILHLFWCGMHEWNLGRMAWSIKIAWALCSRTIIHMTQFVQRSLLVWIRGYRCMMKSFFFSIVKKFNTVYFSTKSVVFVFLNKLFDRLFLSLM